MEVRCRVHDGLFGVLVGSFGAFDWELGSRTFGSVLCSLFCSI